MRIVIALICAGLVSLPAVLVGAPSASAACRTFCKIGCSAHDAAGKCTDEQNVCHQVCFADGQARQSSVARTKICYKCTDWYEDGTCKAVVQVPCEQRQ